MDITQKILADSAAMFLAAGLSTQTAEGLKSPQRTFVRTAAQGGMAEGEMGRFAAQKASNEAVKHFGQHMVDDLHQSQRRTEGDRIA